MTIMPDFTGRVALVTGASRGLGRAIALGLAECGADVCVNYRAKAAEAEEVAAGIRAQGRRAHVVQADVADEADVVRLVAETEAALGPIDVLVNNAGIASRRGLDDLTLADLDRTMAVNFRSAFLVTQAILPGMRQRQWGRIVNMSSGAARSPGGIGLHYNASKAAMEGMTRGYAARLAPEGITVNAVAPMLVETDMIGGPEQRAAAAKRVPLGRLGTPQEVAQATVLLLANGYITGQTLAINGGMLLA